MRMSAACSGSGKASMPMNRLIVKPMPARIVTPNSWRPWLPSGRVPIPSAIAARANVKAPIGLPIRQAERDAERDGREQLLRCQSRERDAGIGERKGRQHAERHPRMERLL